MRPLSILSIAILIAPALAAQSATSQIQPLNAAPLPGQTVSVYNSAAQQTTTVVVPLTQISACPVSVRAQQSSAANSMEVDRSRPKGVAQSLHLTMANPAGSPVAKATVTVRGLLPKTRATLTPMTLGGDLSDATRTLEISFPAMSGPADKSATAELWVPGLSAVYSVDLVSITYADGSTWSPSQARTCRTPVDSLMLIGAR
jgi:hypothetical protein